MHDAWFVGLDAIALLGCILVGPSYNTVYNNPVTVPSGVGRFSDCSARGSAFRS
jgi:hypothetical protein